MVDLKIVTKETFSKNVIDTIESKNIPAMEAIVLCAEKMGLEIETISRLIDKSLKEKVESEAMKLNLLKKTETLPI